MPNLKARVARNSGFTLVEIMIVVAIIGLLAAIAIPSWHRARENTQLNSISNNLRLLESAKSQWAMDQKKSTSDNVTETDVAPYLRNNTLPAKVVGETYGMTTVGAYATATIAGPLLTYPAGDLTVTSF